MDNDDAVRSGEINGTQMFCGLKNEDILPNQYVRSFTAYYNQDVKDTESINIGLIIRDKDYDGTTNTFELPIIVDPNIKNNG